MEHNRLRVHMVFSLSELKVQKDEAFDLDKAFCYFGLSHCGSARCGRKTEEEYDKISATHGKIHANI